MENAWNFFSTFITTSAKNPLKILRKMIWHVKMKNSFLHSAPHVCCLAFSSEMLVRQLQVQHWLEERESETEAKTREGERGSFTRSGRNPQKLLQNPRSVIPTVPLNPIAFLISLDPFQTQIILPVPSDRSINRSIEKKEGSFPRSRLHLRLSIDSPPSKCPSQLLLFISWISAAMSLSIASTATMSGKSLIFMIEFRILACFSCNFTNKPH